MNEDAFTLTGFAFPTRDTAGSEFFGLDDFQWDAPAVQAGELVRAAASVRPRVTAVASVRPRVSAAASVREALA